MIGSLSAALGALLCAIGGYLFLPTENLSRFASHPQPVTEYLDAVRRIDSLRAAERDFNPECHTTLMTHGTKVAKAVVFAPGYGSCPAAFKEIGEQLFERGYNVLIVPLPHDGLADRMNTVQATLRAEELAAYADRSVDLVRGLGDRVTMVGISAGGLVTGWAAQQRADLDRAVIISPGFGFEALPRPLRRPVSKALPLMRESYRWNDPMLKEAARPEHNYPRVSMHALAQIIRFSLATQSLAQKHAPGARSMMVVSNLYDQDIDRRTTDRVVGWWRSHGAPDVQTYVFPAELKVGHDLTDLQQADSGVVKTIATVVHPKLVELITR